MRLFDIIKDPSCVEPAVVLVAVDESSVEEEAQETSEVAALRAVASEVDARDAQAPQYAMDVLAEGFLALCLAQAQQSSVQPYRYDEELEEGFGNLVRVVAVSVLTGDWVTVLNGRESALATVSELRRRGYGMPQHDFRRGGGAWELRIRFSF